MNARRAERVGRISVASSAISVASMRNGGLRLRLIRPTRFVQPIPTRYVLASLRAKRSNPVLCSAALDCFVDQRLALIGAARSAV
jgi:hypothetical protein